MNAPKAVYGPQFGIKTVDLDLAYGVERRAATCAPT
jgi:hypothetical protein